MHRRRKKVAAGLLALCLPLFPANRADAPPLLITNPVTVARGLALGVPTGSAMAPDGSVYVADRANNQVYHIGTDGAVADTIGRPGAGPGEFGMIYRVGVNRITGDLYAFDLARGEINHFTKAGKFLKRAQLPYAFSQVDAVVPLDDGGIAVSGTMSGGGYAKDSAIHVFDANMMHLRSFGPLPPVRSPVVRRMWGAGGLTLTAGGDLLYTRRLPYEIYRYGVDGQLKTALKLPFPNRYGPDDAFDISETATSRTISNSKRWVWLPIPATELPDGTLLSGRIMDTTGTVYDRVEGDGRVRASGKLLPGLKWIIGIDAPRHLVWYVGEDDLEPVVRRATLAEHL